MDRYLRDVNPFAPPNADEEFGGHSSDDFVVASRRTRLVAALVDGLVGLVIAIPAIAAGYLASRSGDPRLELARNMSFVLLSVVLGVGYTALQAFLISTSGQSIGKGLVHIKIVKVDGSPVNFVSGVLLRLWLPGVVGVIPFINIVVGLVDSLLIFRADRRCLHDHVAGTMVVARRRN